MIDAKQVRLINLKKLITEAGTATALAKKAGTDPAYLSQLIQGVRSKSGKRRSVGDDLARRLETAMDKAYGWLDRLHQPVWEDGQSGLAQIPMIDWECDDLQHAIEQSESFIAAPLEKGIEAFALRVESDRMLPEFEVGDVMVLRVEHEPDAVMGRFVIAQRLGEKHLSFGRLGKHLGALYLFPLNDCFSPKSFSEGDRICGTVVYKGRWY